MALKIGDLAKATGTKANTIRFYEEIGLLPAPARTGGNYRVYDASHLRRLAFIRRCRDIGLGIDQVRELLDLADQRDRSCGSVEAIARSHRAAIGQKIVDLQAVDRELGRMIDRCGHGTVAECGILEALAPSTDSTGARE